MSWQAGVLIGLCVVVAGGLAWYERSRPPARLVALVAALAALAVAGRLVLAPIPNVVATTDIALIAGYALGAAPGFAVGALAAPVSNIWLGQGPWTVWQMGGWGMVGLAGAALAAIAGRRLNRWSLAAACGIAGLAYGALLDLHVMVSYGGEQSLDRYLALSARAVPFNVAHVAGNVAIALAAGPALARMISRYRTRLEFRWHPAPALPVAFAALALAASTLVAGLEQPPLARGASAPGPVAWLARAQNDDGGFAATPGDRSSPTMTGWAMLGLEAAGRNPLDVRAGGRDPVDYLRSRVGRLRTAGDLERTILALEGAGLDPRRFAGHDLVAELRRRRGGDGSVSGQVNLTAFYVLAMRAAGVDSGALARSVRWLRRARNDDGGWGFQAGTASDPDSTGAALQALGGGRASGQAVRWLRRAQRANGGYGLATSGVVNAQSTAWAAQGLIAAGAGGKPLRRALGFLERLRAADGHYRYSRSTDQTPVWVTAQALVAAKREAFPLAAVARAPRARGRDGGSSGGGGGSGRVGAGRGEGIQTGSDSVGGGSGAGRSRLGAADAPPAGGTGEGPDRARQGAIGGGSGDRARGAGGSTITEDTTASVPPPSAASTPGSSADADDDREATPYVAGGLALLAAALGGGFLWYRRRLP
ncbi:MAG: hypothetical protein ACRDK9_14040 [Solirubrobacterales bacterium]